VQSDEMERLDPKDDSSTEGAAGNRTAASQWSGPERGMTKKKNRKGNKRKRRRPRSRREASRPVCGLCGSTKNLTKTECCGNWICDDEQDYVLFSFDRNSCHRNHRRLTLCGFHFAEGHEGRWQDCPKCREQFETEMYVWHGTNEYNFEVLPDPPAYEPTLCVKCGRRIVLGEEGYSVRGGEYFCERCTAEGLRSDDLAESEFQQAGPQGGAGRDRPWDTGWRLHTDEGVDDMLHEAPEPYSDRFAEIVSLTDAFCNGRLGDEYTQLSRRMAVDVCQDGSPVLRGKPESWAAGIVYVLGRVNFLSDPDQTPHMKSTEVAKGFGVSVATMQAKAKVIREGLDVLPFDPDWTLPSRLADNPLVWMAEVSGTIVDLRSAPREWQIAAYQQGLIPYVPADGPR